MYTEQEYKEMAEKANSENKVLYIVGTGLAQEDGSFDGELILADEGYYICLPETNITNGLINPEYEDQKKAETLRKLRAKRERICFPIVNRGKTWYDNLSVAQYEELKAWYQAWLCVTDTLAEPISPAWL